MKYSYIYCTGFNFLKSYTFEKRRGGGLDKISILRGCCREMGKSGVTFFRGGGEGGMITNTLQIAKITILFITSSNKTSYDKIFDHH